MPRTIKKRFEKDDEPKDVQETIDDIRARLAQRQKTLAYSLIALAVVASLAGGIFFYQKMVTDQAVELEAQGALLYYGSPGQKTQLPPAERYGKALDTFKQSYDKKARPTALLYIANSYYELGKYDDALSSLNLLVGKFPDSPLAALAYLKLGDTYLKKKETDNALNAYKSLYSLKSAPLQDLAMVESARLLDMQGKKEESKALYKELISRFPKSPFMDEAKKAVGEGEK